MRSCYLDCVRVARGPVTLTLAVMVSILAKIGPMQSKALWLALTVACLLVLGAFWQWVVMDWVTPFLFPAVRLIGTGLLALSLVVSIFSLVSQLRKRQGLDVGPVAINVVTVAVLYFVPFTRLWLDANYYWYRASRNEVVEQIRTGLLKPNVSHNAALIRLDGMSKLSLGGNEVVVRSDPQGTYVLFFTFRGILDHYSGFLYVPEGGSPESYAQAEADRFIEVIPIEPHWFFVAAASRLTSA